jgi:uncharacterized protein
MDTEVIVVRVYLKETDHGRRKPLMEEILNILHDQHRVHGVVVFRGIAGFGSKGEVHAADILRLTVIEFYDEPAVALAAIDLLNGLVSPGHLVHWRASCRNFPQTQPARP